MKRFGVEFDQKSKQLIINWWKRTFMKKNYSRIGINTDDDLL